MAFPGGARLHMRFIFIRTRWFISTPLDSGPCHFTHYFSISHVKGAILPIQCGWYIPFTHIPFLHCILPPIIPIQCGLPIPRCFPTLPDILLVGVVFQSQVCGALPYINSIRFQTHHSMGGGIYTIHSYIPDLPDSSFPISIGMTFRWRTNWWWIYSHMNYLVIPLLIIPIYSLTFQALWWIPGGIPLHSRSVWWCWFILRWFDWFDYSIPIHSILHGAIYYLRTAFVIPHWFSFKPTFSIAVRLRISTKTVILVAQMIVDYVPLVIPWVMGHPRWFNWFN